MLFVPVLVGQRRAEPVHRVVGVHEFPDHLVVDVAGRVRRADQVREVRPLSLDGLLAGTMDGRILDCEVF